MFKLITITAIDAVQSAQKTAVNTFVKNESFAKSLTSLIDAQTESAKKFLDVIHATEAFTPEYVKKHISNITGGK